MPRQTTSQHWRARAQEAMILVALLALAAGVIGLLEYAHGRRRTVYHGRSLAEWLAALGDTRAGVRDTAAYALTRLVPASPAELPTVIRAEAHVLGDADEDVQAEATAALITLGPRSDSTVPDVIEVLGRSANPSARVHAVQVLGGLGSLSRPATPVVIGALGDSSAAVRLVAVGALARIGLPVDQLAVVARLSTDSDAAVRAAAIESLIALHAPDAMLLAMGERAARDPEAVVRAQALYALASSDSPERVVPRLVAALTDVDPLVRAAAATVLGRLGPEARSAMVALEHAAADSDREVRAVAAQSLRSVRRQPR
jgi:HEAT repeat protein